MDDHNIETGFMKSFAAQMIADGVINPSGMSMEEFRAAFFTELQTIVEEDGELLVVLDHQDSVLKQARAFAKSGDADFAIMFYATWIEHWLNDMFIWKVQRLRRPQAEADDLIRCNGLKSKTGKVWTASFGEELNKDLAAAILDIADRRNAFVHYKWPALEGKELDDKNAKREAILATAEPVVRQLTALKTALVLGDSHRLLEGI